MVILTDVLEASSSSSDHHQKYDVFLSYRGIDTRLSFTDHLHKALEGANLKTFLDNEEIETGQYLKLELETAIKASRASVIVLSKNYAFSTWCLDELVLILDQHRTYSHIVIPVFYHVEPNDVRKHQNSYKDAMDEHKRRMEVEANAEKKSQLAKKIEIWKKALTQVSHLTGMDARGWLETEFIEEIIKDVYHKIRIPIRSTLPLLIGMDDSIKFITSWLKDGSSHVADILTVFGMGGIGKTSLAKYVHGLHCCEFKGSSFIESINRRCMEYSNGLIDLQKQLCGDIANTSSIQVHNVSIYTSTIESALTSKKVFLVLDDIDSLNQLDVLLGNKGFHPGSKIIITTRNMSLTERSAVFNLELQPKHTTHLLRGLYDDASRKLLRIHAFKCEKLKEGYEDVLDYIVKYCEGHPLALEVLGRSLRNRDVAYWEDCIEGLKKEPGFRINNVLKMSFDSLESNNDKKLFKHIACFFVGIDRDLAETILKACDINTRTGITHLVDRCLLHDDRDNILTMHSLIQEMGRNEVRKESPEKPWKRSRLWCHKESFKVLDKKKGTGKIMGLTLNMKMLGKEKLCGSFDLKTDASSKMDNLKILHLDYVQISGFYENFPKELRWLRMHGFPLKSMPSNLPMEKLVVLDLSYSNIESFGMPCNDQQQPEYRQKLIRSWLKDTRLLGSLKILDVSFCKQLCSLGGFFELPALERLIVYNCISLIELCESIEQCVELLLVDLRYCNNLVKLPKSLGKLKKVKTLLLDGGNSSESQIETRDVDSLKLVNVKSIDITSQTSSSATVVPRDLRSMAISFPSSLVKLSLAYNNLSCESFPMDLSCLSMLRDLELDDNPVVSMPNCVRTLPRLEYLSMNDCNMLTSIEHPPCTLRTAFIYSPLLRKVAFDPQMSPLKLFVVFSSLAHSSMEIEGLIKIQPMAGVEESVLRSLGWSNLDFTKKRRIGTYYSSGRPKGSQTQMYYEFGIFSTIYGGNEMLKWIRCRSKGSSISFILPSSLKKLTGLNFCYVQTSSRYQYATYGFRYGFGIPDHLVFELPMIRISNKTKNRTWIYVPYIKRVNVGGKWLTFISHWMFGMNDMEPGDHVTIKVEEAYNQFTNECGVSLVYDGGNMEEDVLRYYKSWNYIIGGDLSAFQLTTGEYLLNITEFGRHNNKIFNYHSRIANDARYKEKQNVYLTAFSQ